MHPSKCLGWNHYIKAWSQQLLFLHLLTSLRMAQFTLSDVLYVRKILSRLQRYLQIQEPASLLPALQNWTIRWERCQPMKDPPSTHLREGAKLFRLCGCSVSESLPGVLDPPPTSFSLPLAVFWDVRNYPFNYWGGGCICDILHSYTDGIGSSTLPVTLKGI